MALVIKCVHNLPPDLSYVSTLLEEKRFSQRQLRSIARELIPLRRLEHMTYISWTASSVNS